MELFSIKIRCTFQLVSTYLKIAEYHRRVDVLGQTGSFGELDGSVCAAKDKTLVLA